LSKLLPSFDELISLHPKDVSHLYLRRQLSIWEVY